MRGARKAAVLDVSSTATAKENQPRHLRCPDHLTGLARDTWDYIAPRLYDAKIFEEVDVFTLEAYCSTYERYRKALADVAANGESVPTTHRGGGLKSSPAALVLKDTLQHLRGLSGELQLHSLARSRTKTEFSNKKAGVWDDF